MGGGGFRGVCVRGGCWEWAQGKGVFRGEGVQQTGKHSENKEDKV